MDDHINNLDMLFAELDKRLDNDALPMFPKLIKEMIHTKNSSKALLLYSELLDKARIERKHDEFSYYTFYSLDYIMHDNGCSKFTSKNILNKLVVADLIKIEKLDENNYLKIYILPPSDEDIQGWTVNIKDFLICQNK